MNLLKESCYEKEKYMRIPTETAKHLYYCAQWTGHFICKSDFRIKRSDFPGFLLIYTSSGSGNLIYKGSKYHIGANSFCLLDCLTPHEYTTTAAPWDFKFLHFCGNSSRIYHDYIISLNNSPVFPCRSADAVLLMDKITQNVHFSGEEVLCSEYIYRILTGIIASFANEDNSFSFRVAMNYIAKNYLQDIDINSLANKFNLSRSYFTTKFKEEIGISPHAYLVQCRISAAKALLLNSSCNSFIRTFKNTTGTTPMKYRRHS